MAGCLEVGFDGAVGLTGGSDGVSAAVADYQQVDIQVRAWSPRARGPKRMTVSGTTAC